MYHVPDSKDWTEFTLQIKNSYATTSVRNMQGYRYVQLFQ